MLRLHGCLRIVSCALKRPAHIEQAIGQLLACAGIASARGVDGIEPIIARAARRQGTEQPLGLIDGPSFFVRILPVSSS